MTTTPFVVKVAQSDAKDTTFTRYQAMTSLPREIEEKLLTFNILQLCALVSEKPGTRWIGASDQYGPIKEISKRWKLDDLIKRIEEIQPEEPLRTYSRIMTAIGGNPARDTEVKRRQDNADTYRNESKKEPRVMKVPPKKKGESDPVKEALAGCTTIMALRTVAKANNLPISDAQWVTIEGLPNNGLQRMYVGNVWRTAIRAKEKGE